MPEDKQLRWPLEGEIDILEWTGNEPHRIIGAIHFGDLPPGNVHYSETLRSPSKWSEAFHTFGVEWSPQRITWYVDGRAHGVATPTETAPWPWVFDDKPFHLIFLLWRSVAHWVAKSHPRTYPRPWTLTGFVSIPGTAVQRVSPPRSRRPPWVNSGQYLRCSPDSETPVCPQSSGPLCNLTTKNTQYSGYIGPICCFITY